MEELLQLVSVLNEQFTLKIPEINRGGCGVFAHKMAVELEKLGYKPKIKVMFRSWDDLLERRKEVLNKVINNVEEEICESELADTSFAHCFLEVDGIYFDALDEGEKLLDQWNSHFKISGDYTLKELETSLQVGSWNSTYGRSERNPIMSSIIEESINQIFCKL